jgi:lipopolysaccharide export LptBFGC system permease protein LptF
MVILDFGTLSFIFVLLAFFFLSLVLLSYLKKAQTFLSLLFSILFVFAGYVGLMTAIQ